MLKDDEEKLLLSIRAQDIQTGLQDHQEVPYFETLPLVGMAARLAIHIRGRDAIEYDLLKELAAHLFGVPKIGFVSVLAVLQDVEFVRVVGQNSTERRVTPYKLPYFNELYGRLSEYAEDKRLDEHESASVEILNRLARGPLSRRTMIKELGLDTQTADLVLKTGQAGSYINSFNQSDGDEILISPVYFSEKPDELAKVIEKQGVELAFSVLDAIRKHPGWPLSAVINSSAIGNTQLHMEQVQFIQELVQRGILQPPAVETASSGKNHFLFTPPIGNERIPVVEKEIYEKAMALIAAVRQGQHFARYRVKSPLAVLHALSRDSWLRATTEAKEQWRAVALLRICKLKLISSGQGWHEVHLIPTEENEKALRLALQLLEMGDVTEERGLNPEAHLMLEGGGIYQEALRGLGSFRSRSSVPGSQSHIINLVDRLMEGLQYGT